MDKFWQLLSESVVVQAITTLILISVCSYLALNGREIPDLLANATLLTLGFYFGTKAQQAINIQRR